MTPTERPASLRTAAIALERLVEECETDQADWANEWGASDGDFRLISTVGPDFVLAVATLLRLIRDHERDGTGCESCIAYAHHVADRILLAGSVGVSDD